jgi:8-hydroxy-5-deazaflavin:NADPH oxidoreductase
MRRELDMNVTIIGTGNMGRGIGHTLVRGGHTLTLIDRDREAARALARELQGVVRHGSSVRDGSFDEGIDGDVVVLAVWYGDNLALASEHRDRLAGKVVVDIANPLNATYDGLVTEPGSSSAEELATVLPGARVVKAFNTTFAGTLTDGRVADQPLDVFIAGDDASAKRTVADLVESGGLTAIDAGPLHRARQLEGLGLLGVTLQGSLGTGFTSAWRIVH